MQRRFNCTVVTVKPLTRNDDERGWIKHGCNQTELQ